MKNPSTKNSNANRPNANQWSVSQLLRLAESLDQAYGTGEVARNDQDSVGWSTQQLLDMSAAKAQLFI